MYLDSFVFPDADWEWNARLAEKRTCYNTMYPMGVLSGIGLERLDFAPITILYGGNGTGKTTALNVMAAKLGLLRDTPGNSSTFMEAYVRACRANLEEDIPAHSRMVTSDDVFDYMLNLRELNTHIDQEREKLFQEHTQARHTVFQLRNLDDYEELKKRNSARRKTQSAFVREQLGGNVREMSNGESALFYGKDPGQRSVPAGRAGEQPQRRKTAGAGGIPGGIRPIRGVPAGDCHPFALPAGHGTGENLRFRYPSRGGAPVDGAEECAGLRGLFPGACGGV